MPQEAEAAAAGPNSADAAAWNVIGVAVAALAVLCAVALRAARAPRSRRGRHAAR